MLTERRGGYYEQDPIGGGAHYLITIYPTFIRNAQGGYDGADAAFGYSAVLFAAGAFLVLRVNAEPRLANDQIDG